jgi:hypothetical protein
LSYHLKFNRREELKITTPTVEGHLRCHGVAFNPRFANR